MIRIGYKASAEQFGPVELLQLAVLAERLGLDSVAVSDHFQPWRHSSGHAPNSLAWLGAAGQATSQVSLATSVLTPTMRYQPAIIAQAFATLACLNPGRIILGLGSGEAMNETPATAAPWPTTKERRHRLAEAIQLIRELWTNDRVSFHGDYYHTDRATIYEKPDQPIPIHVAASGPLAARLAGQTGDGLICTSGKHPDLYQQLLTAFSDAAQTAGRDPHTLERMIEIKVSYDRDPDYAHTACNWWAALALTADEKSGTDDPIELEHLADQHLDRAHTRFIVTNNPHECAQRIRWYTDLGFTHLILHAPGPDQPRFLHHFTEDVLPLLRDGAA